LRRVGDVKTIQAIDKRLAELEKKSKAKKMVKKRKTAKSKK